MALTADQAQAVWGVLMEECEANPNNYDEFRHYVCTPDRLDFYEFRFCGALGFGGKFNIKNGGDWYVTFYREDYTEARESMREAANVRLRELRQQDAAGGTA